MIKSLKFFLLLIIFYTVSLFAFIEFLPTRSIAESSRFDLIAVLTGGTQRIETGLRLLKQEIGKHLMISGVDRRVSLEQVKKGAHFEGTIPASRITLDYEARTTRENAIEIAKFVQEKNIQSVLIVTADYHLWRTQIELNRRLPKTLRVRYLTVHPIERSKRPWCSDYQIFCVYLVEFNKLIGASVRYGLWLLKAKIS